MSSYVLAIYSTPEGDPYRGPDAIGHVVRVAPYEQMPVVNEFTSGGPLAHVACAPSVIQSRLIQGGLRVPIAQIEEIAGTHVPAGTLFPGIQRALRYYGVANTFTDAAPPAGWIMNPAGGRLIPPALFPSYLAASQGGCIVMADPVVPPPTPIEEPEMQTFEVNPTPGGGPPLLVPGVTGSSTLILAAYASCTFEMFLWASSGGSVAARTVTLTGNQPGKVGPVELSGYLSDLFAAPPATPGGSGPAKAAVPYLLGLFPGSGTYFASVY